MKRTTAATHLAVLLALGMAPAGCTGRAAGRVLAQSPTDSAAIRRLEDEFSKAKVANDAAAIGRIVAADYYGVNQNGNARDREQLIELFKTFPVQSLDVDIERLRISGDNAVVAGRQRQGCRGSDCPEICVFLRTYVRRDGRWQLLTNAHYVDPNKGGPATNTWVNDSW